MKLKGNQMFWTSRTQNNNKRTAQNRFLYLKITL